MTPPKRLPKTLVLSPLTLASLEMALTSLRLAQDLAGNVSTQIREFYDAHGDPWQEGHGEYLQWLDSWDRAEDAIAQALAALADCPRTVPG